MMMMMMMTAMMVLNKFTYGRSASCLSENEKIKPIIHRLSNKRVKIIALRTQTQVVSLSQQMSEC